MEHSGVRLLSSSGRSVVYGVLQVEFVYDYYLQLYGVREIAEKELHMLFTSIRQFASRHPRVRLFALFCGIPMTVTLSTCHGYFNLDTHLKYTSLTAVQSRRSSALAEKAAHRQATEGSTDDSAQVRRVMRG